MCIIGAMTIFAIIATTDEAALAQAIARTYPAESMTIRDGVWLVNDAATSLEVANKLGLGPEGTPPNKGVVLSTRGYYGYAPNNIWEWLEVKSVETSNG
jgi:hypothetical protein